MSIRAIAGVGVVLCLAMTSFSIYLGIAEHVYAPKRAAYAAYVVRTPMGRHTVCVKTGTGTPTTVVSQAARCHAPSTSKR